jgi:hypothetical protein
MVADMVKLIGRHSYSPEIEYVYKQITTRLQNTPKDGRSLSLSVIILQVPTAEFVGLYVYTYTFN